ncbi:MAG: hypothetical protein AseanaTS_19280 [Candidatus Pelagadaptatus aseana]|uniref:VOC family protein n=1 Tax=Candidatus Pelagadaptatus aseana TaxID=3120508 RepID=UPI0039B27517
MTVTGFARIRICCEDLFQAINDYTRLLGVAPYWSGQYRWLEDSGRLLDYGAVAWFYLENTRIELYDSSRENAGQGISGVVLAVDDLSTVNKAEDMIATQCHYSDSNSSCVEDRLLCVPTEHEAFEVSLVAGEGHDDAALKTGDIARVDHLVLYSRDGDACIERFGETGMGLRLALDKTVPEWGGRMLFFRTGKLTLEVIVPNESMSRPDFFWGIAYQTGLLDGCLKRLDEAGVAMSESREGRKPGTRVATVKSCDLGVPTLLIEPQVMSTGD